MKIIGVMGNSGSGKTTFSDCLSSKKSVGIIHVDDLVGEAKKKYFKFFLQPKEKNTTEQTKNNPKLKTGSKAFFYKNKLTFNFLMKLRSMLVMSKIEKQLSKFKKDGKELVLIDDWVLSTHKKLLKKLTHIYVLERKYLDRRRSYQKRDDLSKEEVKISDLPYALGLVKIPNSENVTRISNNGSIEDLYASALEVYSKYVEPTFDERYKIKTPIQTLSQVSKTVSRVRDSNSFYKNEN